MAIDCHVYCIGLTGLATHVDRFSFWREIFELSCNWHCYMYTHLTTATPVWNTAAPPAPVTHPEQYRYVHRYARLDRGMRDTIRRDHPSVEAAIVHGRRSVGPSASSHERAGAIGHRLWCYIRLKFRVCRSWSAVRSSVYIA